MAAFLPLLHLSPPRCFYPLPLPHRSSSKTPRSPSAFTAHASLRGGTELNKGIAEFYDASSTVWEDLWGEHMHHGYYDPGSSPWDAIFGDRKAPQIRMIEETLTWAGVSDQEVGKPRAIVDVGCGIGGSSRYLARKYGAEVNGITLSSVQARRATELAASAGLTDKVSFQVADALNQPFPDDKFDLVWSMESGEHMPDKEKFMRQLIRVAAPGGRIIIVTWCHRDLLPGESSLQPSEQKLLDRLCDAYYLPAWCATSNYVELARNMHLQDIKSADWTEYITPFWPAVIITALSWKGLFGLATSGWTTIRGALAMALMVQGYNSGLIKFAIITGQKMM